MRRLIAVIGLLTVIVGLTGCGLMSQPALAPEAPGTQEETRSDGSGVADSVDAAEPTADRSVVRTAVVTVGADDPTAAGRRAESAATDLGGYVESVSTDGDRTATVVLRVPADRYDAALAVLREQGEVMSLEVAADDVTATQTDLDARIRAQRASVARVQDLMKRAGSLSEVVQVEQELASRQSELESLVSQRDRLAEQVALATVTATFVPRGASGSPGWWTPAGDALVAAWQGLVVLVAALSPVIVLAAVAAAATLAVVRRTRRRRADAPLPREPVA